MADLHDGATQRLAARARAIDRRCTQDPNTALSIVIHVFHHAWGASRVYPNEQCVGLIHVMDLFHWRTGNWTLPEAARPLHLWWSRDRWWPAERLKEGLLARGGAGGEGEGGGAAGTRRLSTP